VKTIMYRVQYTGVRMVAGSTGYVARSEDGGPEFEFVQVRARDINSGYSKALMLAREPLGSGDRRHRGVVVDVDPVCESCGVLRGPLSATNAGTLAAVRVPALADWRDHTNMGKEFA